MTTQTTGTQTLIRTTILAALLALLALSTVQPARADENDQDFAGNAARVVAWMCEAAGGTAVMQEDRTVGSGRQGIEVQCKGGLLDGWSCYAGNYTKQISCYTRYFTRPVETVDVEPVGEAEIVDGPVSAPETVDEVVTPGPAEDVVHDEPPVDETATPTPEPDPTEEPVVEEPVVEEPVVEEPVVEEPVVEEPEIIEDVVQPDLIEEPAPDGSETVDGEVVYQFQAASADEATEDES